MKAKLWGGLSLPDIKVYYYGTNSNQGGNGRWIDKWASEIVLKVLKDSYAYDSIVSDRSVISIHWDSDRHLRKQWWESG